MGSIAGDDVGGRKEERILVSVRLRPLNGTEIERNDVSDWECINESTLIYKHSLPERSMYPCAYTFDRVFGCDSSTRQVYEDGAREVALSVVSGINSSIFAYGQTSSGKTYTMTGITECSVSEIYDYIEKHPEREFILKFSAIEIYNESVNDLLSPESGPLRLLDDPEKGIVVDKLTEETLRDKAHLMELLSVCEAQRQIGETSLNEVSSRSHQILRLSIESSAREYSGRGSFSTLTATVNFVDLAGSERASQAHTAGSRLKEGCHINRSLLTLGTVIRKLSKARNGHVPYRDSKLTRILQSSLGGNARTAIICTVSPARSHIEQSRNTLQFASCAKEVVTSAQVNVVMSDKALVKHLRKELSRLENELRYMGPAPMTCGSDVLQEKETLIKKMEQEMQDLIRQRDLAQSRLEDLLRTVGDDQTSGQWEELSQYSVPPAHNLQDDTLSVSDASSGISYQIPARRITMYSESAALSEDSKYHLHISSKPGEQHAISPLYHAASTPDSMKQDNFISSSSPDYEDHCREVRCIEMIEPSLNKLEDFSLLSTEDIDSLLPPTIDHSKHCDREVQTIGYADLKNKAEKMTKETCLKNELIPFSAITLKETDLKNELKPLSLARNLISSKRPPLVRSRSCRATLMMVASSPWFQDEEYDNTPPSNLLKDFPGRPGGWDKTISAINYNAKQGTHSRDGSENSEQSSSNDVLKPQNDNIRNSTSVGELEEMIHIQNEKKLSADQEVQYAANKDSDMKIMIKDVCLNPILKSSDSPSRWQLEFEKKQREILELWHLCNVSLLHRSYFFLLIKGDPTDSIYTEVEHRRLSFIKNSSSHESLNKNAVEENVLDTSLKNLRREREKLSRLMNKLPIAERESLYKKWGIALGSKQRRLQLSRQVWTETRDMEHVRESAMLVAKLYGILEPGLVPKEMFGLSFTPQLIPRGSFSWKRSRASFR